MNLIESIAIIGGKLGEPAKMPCYTGQSMPNTTCKRGSELVQNKESVCSMCYASRGHYMTSNVQNRLWERWEALTMAHEDGRLNEYELAFSKVLLEYVASYRPEYFRWFDSGDLQGGWHIESIERIINMTEKEGAQICHWLPTHENKIVINYAKKNNKPKNLIIRVSQDMINKIDDDIKRIIDVGLGASVVCTKDKLKDMLNECRKKKITAAICTAKYNPDGTESGRNKCGPCKLCWNPNIQVIIYPKH